ncbi:hypothetical protein BH10PSE12_BH10PSE12_06200 [soil metagenome]
MDREAAPPEASDGTAEPSRKCPRASHWLWRPWYAKLWWAGVAVCWTGQLASHWSPALDELYTSALAGYLNIAFYPLTVLMVLGVRFVHAWMDYKGLEWGPPTHDELFPERSVGGLRDPMADPLDPRSPLHWRYLEDIQ